MTMTRRIRSLLASATCLAASALGAAHAQEQAGLPMWVIKDADSTIYMTGTVHMLPPDVKWDSEKLHKAIKDADELWLELPMSSDPMKFAMEAAPKMMPYALSPGRPLSSLLTKEEKAALDDKIAKSNLPAGTSAAVNMMKPWYATLLVGISPLMAAGFDPAEGIDVKIAKLAEDDKDPIKGFETVEEQTKILASGTEEEQLAALRVALKMTDAEVDEATKKAEAAFTAWAKGDVDSMAAYFEESLKEEGAMSSAAAVDALLKNRNENWAGQIETMLKGKGTHFIAVGGGHLVGPDSVQERLKLRGIKTERY